MEIKTSQFPGHSGAEVAPSLNMAPDISAAFRMWPVSNLDSISYEFVPRDPRPHGTNNLSDERLYELCETYGQRAKFWRRKFAGLLPEVNKRRLFEKKSFGSVTEFAAKLAGMGEEQVRIVLHLGKIFEDKPILKNILENEEVSINKLARITAVVTKENQEFWATQVKILSKKALETLVRDEKYTKDVGGVGNNINVTGFDQSPLQLSGESGPPTGTSEDHTPNLQKNISIEKLVPGHELNQNSISAQGLSLSRKVTGKLLELQRKGIDVNSLLLEFLEDRELKIAQEKEQIAKNVESTNSRYIPTRVRNILRKEHGTKCSISTCTKSAEIIHHTQRYGLSQNHDPHFLAPLCREHHAIAHTIDIKYQQARIQMIN